jgi:hypothetical protein
MLEVAIAILYLAISFQSVANREIEDAGWNVVGTEVIYEIFTETQHSAFLEHSS